MSEVPTKIIPALTPRGQTCDRDALSSLGHDCPKGRSTYPVNRKNYMRRKLGDFVSETMDLPLSHWNRWWPLRKRQSAGKWL